MKDVIDVQAREVNPPKRGFLDVPQWMERSLIARIWGFALAIYLAGQLAKIVAHVLF